MVGVEVVVLLAAHVLVHAQDVPVLALVVGVKVFSIDYGHVPRLVY